MHALNLLSLYAEIVQYLLLGLKDITCLIGILTISLHYFRLTELPSAGKIEYKGNKVYLVYERILSLQTMCACDIMHRQMPCGVK